MTDRRDFARHGWYEGREFVLDVECPSPRCRAPIGVPCFTRRGEPALRGHWSRFEAAVDLRDVTRRSDEQ